MMMKKSKPSLPKFVRFYSLLTPSSIARPICKDTPPTERPLRDLSERIPNPLDLGKEIRIKDANEKEEEEDGRSDLAGLQEKMVDLMLKKREFKLKA